MAQTKKVIKKTAQLPPSRNKATVKSVPVKQVVGPQPAKKMVMTGDDVKKVMLENQALHEEMRRLKQDNEMLGKLLLTAGIVVDEKFGDPELEEVRVPSMKEVAGYKEINPTPKAKNEAAWSVSDSNDDDDNDDEEEDDEEDHDNW